jgi:hypothetical protein
MQVRSEIAAPPQHREIALRAPPNWTAVIFFAGLAGLHICVAGPAFYHGRLEGYMSTFFAMLFATIALLCWRARSEIIIQPQQRRIRVRSGIGRFHFQRYIAFEDVHGVRVTITDIPRRRCSHVELLCDNEDIECPPTSIPREEALWLAMLMNVRLIKVTDDRAGSRQSVNNITTCDR